MRQLYAETHRCFGPYTGTSNSRRTAVRLVFLSVDSFRIPMIKAHVTPYSPDGKDFCVVPGTTTALLGTMPRETFSRLPHASIILVDDVKTTPAPRTAPSPMRTPSTMTHRLPTKTLSSMITGLACTGSNTPPIPTPPARWTFLPICAHEPTVTHVSTIVPPPTRAPIFTNEGIRTQPRSIWLPLRTRACGTTRTPSEPSQDFTGILSLNWNSPEVITSSLRILKYSRIAFFNH